MKNLYHYSIKFITILEKHHDLLEIIYSISGLQKKFNINKEEILNTQSDGHHKANVFDKISKDIIDNNNKILDIIRSTRPIKIYELTNSFIKDLNLFDNNYNNDSTLIIRLKEFTEKHTDAYSEKVHRYIFAVSNWCHKITELIDEIRIKSYYIINEFEKKSNTFPEGYISFKIGSDGDIPLIKSFVLLFEGIEDLYNFICLIHKINPKENPLLINHIETGSWYTDLFGIKQVVISLENLLKGFGSLIRDIITGKIVREKFENECKKARAFIELVALAKENGIDNAELGLLKGLSPLVDNFSQDTTTIDIGDDEILKLKKTEKLTLIEKKTERMILVEKINLPLEEGDKEEDNKEEGDIEEKKD